MSNCIFTKYSNERCRRFAVRTDIMEEDSGRFVVKRPVYEEGKAHVEQIFQWSKMLSKAYESAGMCVNRCGKYEDGVRLEYVEGQTLEEALDELLKRGKTREAEERLAAYLKQIEEVYSENVFAVTDGFKKVFGYVKLPEGLRCGSVTNVDMVCGNLVLSDTFTVLDYEWTFDFPIPARYVMYRVIFYYANTHTARQGLNQEALYRQFGITETERISYDKMEANFQKYITGSHVPMRDLYADMCPGIMQVHMVPEEKLQIYFSSGKGYSEEKSVKIPMRNSELSCKVELPQDCREVRLDPGDGVYAVEFRNVSFDDNRVSLENCPVNGGVFLDDMLYVVEHDPGIHKIPVPAGAKTLTVELKLHNASFDVLKKVYEQQMLIERMKGTKVWKMYESYRKKVERKQ